jgi:hypothetical protein
MAKAKYDKETYDLLKDLLEAGLGKFEVMFKDNKDAVDDLRQEIRNISDEFRKSQEKQDEKIGKILESELPKLKSKVARILGWSAGAGAVGAFVLNIILFLIGKFL